MNLAISPFNYNMSANTFKANIPQVTKNVLGKRLPADVQRSVNIQLELQKEVETRMDVFRDEIVKLKDLITKKMQAIQEIKNKTVNEVFKKEVETHEARVEELENRIESGYREISRIRSALTKLGV